MKNFYYFLCLLCFVSCSEGEMGPPGPPGPEGPPGDPGLIGTVFEVQGNFTAANDYNLEVIYSDFTDLEVFESDVILVYLQVATDGTSEGAPVYVWRLLPQTYYLEGGGTMQYNYDYTFFDTQIFLDASVDLATLSPAFTDNQIFRIAIVPAAFAENPNVNFKDFKSVISALKIVDSEIPTLRLDTM